jgi:exopolysaccharide biosynthesis polyprenyl glycosylphosphotransferase
VFARRQQLFGIQCLIQDLALTALAFPAAYLLRSRILTHIASLGPIYSIRVYWPLLPALVALVPLVTWGGGFYGRVDPREKLRLAQEAIVTVTVACVILLAGLYLFKAVVISRSLVLVVWAVTCVFVAAGRLYLLSSGTWFRGHMERHRYFLVVGTGGPARELARNIEEGHSLGDRLIGFAYTGGAPSGGLDARYRVLPVDTIPALIETEPVDEVIFAVNREELENLEPIMRRCQEDGVHTRVHVDFLPLEASRMSLEHFGAFPLLTFANSPDNEALLFCKRIFDLVLASALIVVFSPLLLLIVIVIKLTSKGPVIYRQTRCGLGGRRFTLYKFRSMVQGADKLRAELEEHNELQGPVFKISNDPRVTSAGRWLRKFSLDELPQLWNIVRGDMSFVGPRPPLAEEVAQYEKWQRRRLRMRPGLTCLWALEGRNELVFRRWMLLDLFYIDHWSLWLDLKILAKTIPLVLRGRGAS